MLPNNMPVSVRVTDFFAPKNYGTIHSFIQETHESWNREAIINHASKVLGNSRFWAYDTWGLGHKTYETLQQEVFKQRS